LKSGLRKVEEGRLALDERHEALTNLAPAGTGKNERAPDQ
jgi:hypothetical protein